MRLILLLLTTNLLFAQTENKKIDDLTQAIVGLDRDGMQELNNSLEQAKAGVSLTSGDEKLSSTNSTSQQNKTTNSTESTNSNEVSTSNTNSVSSTASVSNTESTSPIIQTSEPVSVVETDSTSATVETTEEQICLVPYVPWSEGLFFLKEYKGEDPRIAKIMEKWGTPIDFYYEHGIGTLPTELNQELLDNGISVVYDKTHEELLGDIDSGQCAILAEDEPQANENTPIKEELQKTPTNPSNNTASENQMSMDKLEAEDIPILKDI